MLLLSKIFKAPLRFYSSKAAKHLIEPLSSRTLIRVKGNEANDFLQGLITNDMNHLGKSTGGSMFTMFLNTKGRVLYDAIVYKIANDSFLIECDLEIEKSLVKHMQIYRVRRKIDISSAETDYNLHVLFDSKYVKNIKTDPSEDINQTQPQIKPDEKLMIFKDPRVSELGYRIICNNEVDVKQRLNNIKDTSFSDSSYYKILRYSLGVGEGVNDLPVGNCFPLECNCDYLHGVSFHKGCYIGQELTARTHHTGVVRKRLMPIYFKQAPSIVPNNNSIIIGKSNLGKLRGIVGNKGLALLRVESALELGQLQIENEIAMVLRPHWWPVTLPKEKITQKT